MFVLILKLMLCFLIIEIILIVLLEEIIMRREKMKKYWLVIYDRKNKKSFIKYFDNIVDKNDLRRKVIHSKTLFLIEDSSDILYE